MGEAWPRPYKGGIAGKLARTEFATKVSRRAPVVAYGQRGGVLSR